jgi:TRAP-type mannitol/chloroaromatic compound transport system substrate-binding protein
VDAASANMMWKAIDRNSQDYITLQVQDKVRFYKTPASVLQKQLVAYDEVIAKKSAGNALFTEIVASQKKFAERAVKWEQDVVVDRKMAYGHYFGKPAAPAKKA